MTKLFLTILNMSLSATWLVLLVIVLRLVLRKTPKWINVLLWGMVAFRLLCPFTLESALSLIPSAETVSPEILLDAAPTIDTGIEAVNEAVNPVISQSFAPAPGASANPLQIWLPIAAALWLVGVALMTLYTLISYERLYRRVRSAQWLRENLYRCDTIASPFILGVRNPRIYLPTHLAEPDLSHVLAHEQMHIKRRDHWWKPLGFFLLTIYWFNPILWVAYILLCRDIELACDERTIQRMDVDQRADYSQALLNCSVHRSHIAACPVAFGEVSVKSRIKNVLTYKRPAFWVILLSLLLCAVVAVCFLTDPQTSQNLEWLQNLNASNLIYVEYQNPNAAPNKQFSLYLDKNLVAVTEVLRSFDGEACNPADRQSLLGSGYTLTLLQKNGETHTIENLGNAYLVIDGEYFADTDSILNQVWDPFFSGTTYVPAQSNADLSVYMTVENATPTGASLYLVQYDTRKDNVLFGGNDYILQVQTAAGWEDLPSLGTSSAEDSTYTLDTLSRHTIDWESRYGVLSEGHYRIGKTVTCVDSDSQTHTETIYAEFTLPASVTDPAVQTYVYRDSNLTTDVCTLALYQDGTFLLHQGPLSSNYRRGTYQRSDSQLSLQTEDGARSYFFAINGDTLLYDASRSSKIDMTTAAQALTAVPDGAAFALEFQLAEEDLTAPKITLQDISSTEALLVGAWEDLPSGVYFRGNDFTLQVCRNDQWEDLEMLTPESEHSWSTPTDASILLGQTLRWDVIYGELPDGTYRVCADFHLFYPDSDVIRTAYAEFTLGAGDFHITAEATTAIGATVVYRPAGVMMGASVVTDLKYWLEVYKNGQWDLLEPTRQAEPGLEERGDRIRTLITSDRDRHALNWSTNYGELPAGTYRIGIEFYFRATEQYQNLYAEFTLDGTTNTPYSVTSTLTSDGLHVSADYPAQGGGRVLNDDSLFPAYRIRELVAHLNALCLGDFIASPGVTAETTVTLRSNDQTILLTTDGETVEFSFDDRTAQSIGSGVWATRDSRLLAFLSEITAAETAYDTNGQPLLSAMPETYSLRQAKSDGVITIVDGDIRDNADAWTAFLTATQSETPATVRILKYFSADGDVPASQSLFDLEYDGTRYNLHTAKDGIIYTLTYQYLRHKTDTVYPIQRSFDAYDCYFLTNSGYITATVETLDDDRFIDLITADQYTPILVYTDLTTDPDTPQLSQ